MSCSIIRIAKVRGRLAISSIIRLVSAGDMPEVGSSSSRSSGLAGERDADLELALFAIGQAAAGPRTAPRQMDALHQLLGALDQRAETLDRREEIERIAAPRLDGEPQVFQ